MDFSEVGVSESRLDVIDGKGNPINDPAPETPVPESRRTADATLPYLYRFLLSLVVLVGSFIYLFIAKPDNIIVAAMLGFNGAVITYWFITTSSGSGPKPPFPIA